MSDSRKRTIPMSHASKQAPKAGRSTARVGSGGQVRRWCPNCGRPADHLYSHTLPPESDNHLTISTSHCGCYHEPRGGEKYTADEDYKQRQPNNRDEARGRKL